jgi:putative membrane protein
LVWFLALHMLGNILWSGSLILIASFLALVPDEVGVARERFIVAARRLVTWFGGAAAAFTILIGIILIAMDPTVMRQGWIHAKLTLVLIMLVVHGWLYRKTVALETEPASASQTLFISIAIVIGALTFGILILTLVRPF